ncbi:GDSL-type esterase/lipase family protein [Novosphingobium sp. RD2P27]|uniref:GDSL-type esterase/lipase family protein n=1 Tax=Novosphingobium kalidii TaxID=3230299 RepID=A0ABV2CWG7_9SPHN
MTGPERPVVFFGDCLLAGAVVERGDNYPAKLEAAMRAQGIDARISNAGVSGETTGQALRRLLPTLDAQSTKPDVVIISLGGNDMLQGLPPEEVRANLSRILDVLRERRIGVVLLAMLAAPSLSPEYARDFNPIYPGLADEYQAALVPFYLQPLSLGPDHVASDRARPTTLGVDGIVAATVDDVADALPDR